MKGYHIPLITQTLLNEEFKWGIIKKCSPITKKYVMNDEFTICTSIWPCIPFLHFCSLCIWCYFMCYLIFLMFFILPFRLLFLCPMCNLIISGISECVIIISAVTYRGDGLLSTMKFCFISNRLLTPIIIWNYFIIYLKWFVIHVTLCNNFLPHFVITNLKFVKLSLFVTLYNSFFSKRP